MKHLSPIAIGFAALVAVSLPAMAATETVLYSFTDSGTAYPSGSIFLRNGSLYGTGAGDGRAGDGQVFKLTNKRGSWKESTLVAFGGANGSTPYAGLVRDRTSASRCHLQTLSWVVPNGRYSDHAHITTDLGPQWVASIVNSIGTSPCKDGDNTYWQDTAIIIMWDDWGGWYDHEPPPLNTTLGFQLGFRVPLIVVSAYGAKNSNGQCNPFIDGTDVLDFGSVADFIEGNFFGGWSAANEGKLDFADTRALQRTGTQDLSNFSIRGPVHSFPS